jgi:hypothetical protein
MEQIGTYKTLIQCLLGTDCIHTDQIYYYNFWNTQKAEDIWFTKFINHHKLLENTRKKVYFYSVLGPIIKLHHLKKGVNIFYSGENMQAFWFKEYKLLCEQQPFDLSMGFDFDNRDDYMRFPLWIISLFDPIADYEGVKSRVKQLSEVKYDGRNGFCSLVASHDRNGIRAQIMDELAIIDSVCSGGQIHNNTDKLNTLYANSKYDFISKYKFNICPENSDAPGYVTEKLFHAIEAGCIPVYWGANNKPEPEILNQNALICWNENGNNQVIVDLIKSIYESEALYRDFVTQPRFNTNAEDVIWDYYIRLKNNFRRLFY